MNVGKYCNLWLFGPMLKKISPKKFLIFQEMKVSSTKIKKVLIFQEMKTFSSRNKKTVIFPEMELSSLMFFLYFRRKLSEKHLKK